MCVGVRERTGLYLESIVPVAPPHTLRYIAPDREYPWLPLFDDVAVLVQHEPGIVEELSAAAAQENSAPARRRDGSPMQPHEQRMLEDLHVVHRAPEQRF